MKSGISRCLSYLTLSLLAAIIATSVVVISMHPAQCEATRLDDSGVFTRTVDGSCLGLDTNGTVAADAATQLTPYLAGCPEYAEQPTAEGLSLRITRIKHELSLDDLWREPSLFALIASQSKSLGRWAILRDIPSYDALLLPSVRLQV